MALMALSALTSFWSAAVSQISRSKVIQPSELEILLHLDPLSSTRFRLLIAEQLKFLAACPLKGELAQKIEEWMREFNETSRLAS